ncbi:MAG: hypothetical protein MUF18_04185, partial [Fimbriiglobus sp.]|nr:hypothetical protein [Fimbriiglobus sp.]
PGKLFSRLVASKPLILLQLVAAGLVVAGCFPFLSQAARWVFGVWLTSVSAATVWVYVRAGRRVGRAGQWWWMWVLPALVARLGWIALEGLWTRELTWVRSARTPASSSPAPTG